MSTSDTPQRAWRAACPNCGAPVEFASAASPVAVCSFCRSTLARDGEDLRRIGQSAELFADFSPLQLGSGGRWQGSAFTLIGRLQMRYEGGRWNEWHALFDSGKSGWLSEDNGRYVMAFEAPLPADAPATPEALRAGQSVAIGGSGWAVSAVTPARIEAAQGELPWVPNLSNEYPVVELRNERGEVATLDYGDAAGPHWSIGSSAPLSELALSNLSEAGREKTLRARGLECPSCGAALSIQLDSTQSIVCHQCKAVVDVSQGVGADLKHYAQDHAHFEQDGAGGPLLPLGATGTLALGGPPLAWQVVGYAERCEIPDDPEDEQVFWREYLLYRREVGFAFLVDSEDGWSWATPITGAPQQRGDVALWQGTAYRKLYSYTGAITYVLGEFYWKLERGERTANTDYAAGSKRLSREQAGNEVTWSAGETLEAAVIARAFELPQAQQAALARDAAPAGGAMSALKIIVVIVVALIVLGILLRACSRDECDRLRQTFGPSSNEYQQCRRAGATGVRVPRTGGGSWGGSGSGGGHK